MSKISIILDERRLYLYQAGQILRSFPVAVGKPSTPTPVGNFSIINKVRRPYNPALGSRWMQFTTRMHGIHGTNQPQLIGRAVSHGCVRMYNEDVEYLFVRVEVGSPVEVRKSKDIVGNKQKYIYYTVKRGDSLYKIAKRFNVTVKEIMELNNLVKDLIYPGQQLKISKDN